jgi:hypothetical protein
LLEVKSLVKFYFPIKDANFCCGVGQNKDHSPRSRAFSTLDQKQTKEIPSQENQKDHQEEAVHHVEGRADVIRIVEENRTTAATTRR